MCSASQSKQKNVGFKGKKQVKQGATFAALHTTGVASSIT